MTAPVVIRIPIMLVRNGTMPVATPFQNAVAKQLEQNGPSIISWFAKETVKSERRD
ncbi:MAG: hypothetical protein ABSF22_14260 [Bryobacteraceae bacterium]|jgi:hypothetical protein